MPVRKRLISLGFLAVAAGLGCDDETDSFDGWEVVNQDHAALRVAVVQSWEGELPTEPSSVPLVTIGGVEGLGSVSVSPVVVPAAYGGKDSAADERLTVFVDVGADFVHEVDRADLTVHVGTGEVIESIELQQDALVPTRFFTWLKPSCSSELKDGNGVCELTSGLSSCLVTAGAVNFEVEARCDLFSVRLWRQVEESEATATPTASDAMMPLRGEHAWSGPTE